MTGSVKRKSMIEVVERMESDRSIRLARCLEDYEHAVRVGDEREIELAAERLEDARRSVHRARVTPRLRKRIEAAVADIERERASVRGDSPDAPLRVVLADPDSRLREGLKHTLARHEDVAVVGETGAEEDVLRLVRDRSPDVVVLGSTLLGHVDRLLGLEPPPRLLVLAGSLDRDVLEDALGRGVHGVLSKSDREVVASSLRSIVSGEIVLAPDLAALLAVGSAHRSPRHAALTPRQREILKFLAAGLGPTQIAGSLGISVHAVDKHISRILAKLGQERRVGGRSAAAAR